ncbi:MAG: hypothetical protein JSW61_04215 [Candidatus Thorarchaeota archaeon]|nr:MAG: hypothetical protein JSW61_04215 [Candidatus Thorarchaeota archaeon]
MNWLAKIIAGEPDEFVHAKLMKYGIGEHPGPRIKLTISGTKIGFKGDLDTEKILVRGYLHGVADGAQKVKGIVICYSDRQEAFTEQPVPLYWQKSKGKLASVFKAKLDDRIPLDDIRQLVNVDDPTTFFLLSLSPGDGTKPWKLTTKTSFPKSGPADEEDEEKEKDPVFVKGSFANSPEMMDYILDVIFPDFKDEIGPKSKKISLKHKIVIEDIEVPDDPSLSFSEKRKLAKKKSRLERTLSVDDKELTKEYSFSA